MISEALQQSQTFSDGSQYNNGPEQISSPTSLSQPQLQAGFSGVSGVSGVEGIRKALDDDLLSYSEKIEVSRLRNTSSSSFDSPISRRAAEAALLPASHWPSVGMGLSSFSARFSKPSPKDRRGPDHGGKEAISEEGSVRSDDGDAVVGVPVLTNTIPLSDLFAGGPT